MMLVCGLLLCFRVFFAIPPIRHEALASDSEADDRPAVRRQFLERFW